MKSTYANKLFNFASVISLLLFAMALFGCSTGAGDSSGSSAPSQQGSSSPSQGTEGSSGSSSDSGSSSSGSSSGSSSSNASGSGDSSSSSAQGSQGTQGSQGSQGQSSSSSSSSQSQPPSPANFDITGKWKNTSQVGIGQAQPGSIIVFDGAYCNFISPRDTYSLVRDGNDYKLEWTTVLGSNGSNRVHVVDANNIEIKSGSNTATFKRVS